MRRRSLATERSGLWAGRRRCVLSLVAALALAAAGCSSGGSTTTGPATSGPATSSLRPVATPPTAPARDAGPPAPAADVALAVAATLHEHDFAAPWTRYATGGALARDPASCTGRRGGPEAALGRGAAQRGPTVRFGATSSYAGTNAMAFADAAAAQAWLQEVGSPTWAACQRAALQRIQDRHDRGLMVRSATRATPDLGRGGFDQYASFAIADRAGHVIGYANLGYYRLGRVVIRLGLDVGTMTASQSSRFTADVTHALTLAYDRVHALGQ